MRTAAILLPALAMLLAACDGGDAAEGEAVATADPAIEENPDYDPDAPGAGAEYYYITLLPLRDGDTDVITADMQPVGGCRFLDQDGRILLSVGRPGNRSAPGIGVARPNGKGAVRFNALQPGPDYIDAGPELAVHEPGNILPMMSIVIDRAEGEGEAVGVETMQWPASIASSDPDAQGKPVNGTWSCSV